MFRCPVLFPERYPAAASAKFFFFFFFSLQNKSKGILGSRLIPQDPGREMPRCCFPFLLFFYFLVLLVCLLF